MPQFLWPDEHRIALTSDWDDGTIYDRRLIEIMNRYGLKGSFNLCSGKFGLDNHQSGWKAFVSAQEVADLYQGHEVCSHTINHPRPWSVPLDELRREMLEDRLHLETLVGYPVRGFVIPYGWPTGYDVCKDLVRSCGFLYLRHSESTAWFDQPGDFLDWKPTCHCSADLPQLWATMLRWNEEHSGQLFNVWGHSYEFEDQLGWECMEAFAALASSTPGVWHATKGEVYDYVMAWRRLEWSLNGRLVRNPSAIPVWFCCNGRSYQVLPGQLLHFNA